MKTKEEIETALKELEDYFVNEGFDEEGFEDGIEDEDGARIEDYYKTKATIQALKEVLGE